MLSNPFRFCSEIYRKVVTKESGGDDETEEVAAGQDHVFTFMEELSPEEQKELEADYESIEVLDAEEAWHAALEEKNALLQGVSVEAPRLMGWELKKPPAPTEGANLTKLKDVDERRIMTWRNAGFELYSRERVAIVIMSGAADALMHHGVPRCALDVGLISHKSIFQLYMERIRRLQHLVQRKYHKAVPIPVYIMCNKDNREVMECFVRENDFFGVHEQDVLFFNQRSTPLHTDKGKFILKAKNKVSQYPNGNGGAFKALVEEGMLSDMKSRGVTHIIFCSDNNLAAKVGDPVFVGYCETLKAEAGVKCVERLQASERFGVFCCKVTQATFEDVDGDGRLDAVSRVTAAVVEHLELPEDLKKKRRRVGAGTMPLELSAANLSQYMFRTDFVKKNYALTDNRWHMVPTAAPHIEISTGRLLTPPFPENVKMPVRLELWIFDAFELAKAVVGLEVSRSEMALVRNMSGEESPLTALQALGILHQQWIVSAGGEFLWSKVATDREDARCEISPLVSYAGEDLGGQFPKPVMLPFYLASHVELTEFSAVASPHRRGSTHYVDWQSPVAQRELDAELWGRLRGAAERVEDPQKLEYEGERAAEDEQLPPTPEGEREESDEEDED